jgi:hypothetical protein
MHAWCKESRTHSEVWPAHASAGDDCIVDVAVPPTGTALQLRYRK